MKIVNTNYYQFKLSYYLFIIFSLNLVSCTNESFNSDELLTNSHVEYTKPKIINGVLSFTNVDHLNLFMKAMYDLDNNEGKREQNYNALGLSKEVREKGAYYSEYPSSQLFDLKNNFTSKRQIIERYNYTQLNSEIRSPGFLAMGGLSYLYSALNSDGSIKIGSRIYTFLRDGFVTIVPNNDFYTALKLYSRNEKNVRLVHRNWADEYFIKEFDGSVSINPKIDLHVEEIPINDNNVQLSNKSYVETINGEKPIYRWDYSDGSHEYGEDPVKILTPTTKFTLTVFDKIDEKVLGTFPPTSEENNTGDDSDTITIRKQCATAPEYHMTRMNSNHYYFEFPKDDSEDGQIVWTYKCPGSEPVEVKSHKFSRTFCCFGSVNVELCVESFKYGPSGDEPRWCCGETTIEIEPSSCRNVGTVKDEQEFKFQNGEEWKIEVEGWVEKSGFGDFWTPGEVGSLTRSFKKNSSGKWKKTKPHYSIAGIRGYFVNKDEDCKVYGEFGDSKGYDDEEIQHNVDHNGARLMPKECENDPAGMIYSVHSLSPNGSEELHYSKNGGKLVIVD